MAWNIGQFNVDFKTKKCERIIHPYITIANKAYD